MAQKQPWDKSKNGIIVHRQLPTQWFIIGEDLRMTSVAQQQQIRTATNTQEWDAFFATLEPESRLKDQRCISEGGKNYPWVQEKLSLRTPSQQYLLFNVNRTWMKCEQPELQRYAQRRFWNNWTLLVTLFTWTEAVRDRLQQNMISKHSLMTVTRNSLLQRFQLHQAQWQKQRGNV